MTSLTLFSVLGLAALGVALVAKSTPQALKIRVETKDTRKTVLTSKAK